MEPINLSMWRCWGPRAQGLNPKSNIQGRHSCGRDQQKYVAPENERRFGLSGPNFNSNFLAQLFHFPTCLLFVCWLYFYNCLLFYFPDVHSSVHFCSFRGRLRKVHHDHMSSLGGMREEGGGRQPCIIYVDGRSVLKDTYLP